jgi:parallel beta-helix repeat protein
VRVLAGTFAETVAPPRSGTAGNPITYSAAPGVVVTGNGTGTGSAFRFFGLSYIVIDGFTVISAAENGIYVSGSNLTLINNRVAGTTANGIFVTNSDNVTISNNQVNTSGASGILITNVSAATISTNTSDHNTLDGIRLSGCTNNMVRDNTTFANGSGTPSVGNGIAVIKSTANTSTANTILHNVVYANRDTGLQFDTGSHDNLVIGNLSYNNGDHGIDNNNAPNQTIVGNTFQGNFTSGINLEANSTGSTVVNNIVADNGLDPSGGRKPHNIYVDSTSVSGATLDYNLYSLTSPYTRQINWNNVSYNSLAAFQAAVPGQEIHGVQADPRFVAPAAPATDPPSVVTGDYHLLSRSPAIDSANSNAPGEPTSDIEGKPRVDDSFTPDTGAGARTYDDRGAHEFQPTGMIVPLVTTQAVTDITQTTATGNGNVTDLGIPNPTQHGVVWSTSPNPTTANSKTTDGPVSATGAFTSSMTGLTPGTLYYVRAYAANDAGTFYGGVVTFTTRTTYYVNNTVACSDSGPGTSAQPFCTIGRGAALAAAGDTVRVVAGSYAETVVPSRSGTAGNPITYSAAPGVVVTGNGTGTGSAFRFFGLSYIVIDGFNVNGTSENGIYVSGSNLTLTNNYVTGAAANGIYVEVSNGVTISNNHVNTSIASGISLWTVSSATINGNISDHNTQDGIRLSRCTNVTVRDNITYANNHVITSDGNGIAVLIGSTANTILHNVVYANRDTGLQFDSGSHDNLVIGNLSYNNGDHGIDNYSAPNQTIVGNTIQGNFTSGINLEANSTGATVVNNIVADNGLNPSGGRKPYNIYVDSTSVSGATLDFNLYSLTSPYTRQVNWNGVGYNSLAAFQAAVPGQEIHGVQADPRFVAPAAPATDPPSVVTGDYHLLAGSPAIDSAKSDAPNEPTLDIEGNPRMDDPSTLNTGLGIRTYDDRGAYEFQAAVLIDKTTNGSDGLTIPVGCPITWSYVVGNVGNVTLTNVMVADNKGVAVSCPKTTLAAGESITCTATGTAIAGAYSNTGTVTGTPPTGGNVTASDDSSYFGLQQSISINKTTNGSDGLTIPVGAPITWSYVVRNTGNVTLTNVMVADSKGVAVTCPKTALAAGESMTCTATGTAVAGAYSNTGTVTGISSTGSSVTASDDSNYFGAQKCAVCKGGTVKLTFQYLGVNPAQIAVYDDSSAKPDKILYQGLLKPGEQLTITPRPGKDKLNNDISLYINNVFNTKIKTDCSKAIGPGLVSGDFVIIEAYSKDNGLMCPLNVCAPLAAPGLVFHDREVQWNITNNGDLGLEIRSISITWPSANGALDEIRRDGDTIHKGDFLPPSAVINSGWEGNTDKRIIKAGETDTLKFKFKNTASTGGDYLLRVDFVQGCYVEVSNSGGTTRGFFTCPKPMAELTIIGHGSAQDVWVPAWKASALARRL